MQSFWCDLDVASKSHDQPLEDCRSQHIPICLQVIWSEYTRECKAILTAIEVATVMEGQAEEHYANAQTQQQADTANANIRHAINALTKVCF